MFMKKRIPPLRQQWAINELNISTDSNNWEESFQINILFIDTMFIIDSGMELVFLKHHIYLFYCLKKIMLFVFCKKQKYV